MRTPLYRSLLLAGICLGTGFFLGRLGREKEESRETAVAPSRKPAALAAAESTSPRSAIGQVSLEGLNHDQVKQRTLEVLREPDRYLRWQGLYGIIAGMNEQNAAAISDAVGERHSSGANTRAEGELVQFREGQVLREGGMKDVPKEPNGKPNYPTMNRMKGWASADPASARAWIEKLEPGQTKDTLLRNWREGLSQATPNVIAGILPSLPPEQQRPLIGGMLAGMFDSDGFPAVKAWYDANIKSGRPDIMQTAFSSIVERMTQSPEQWDQIAGFIKNQPETVDTAAIAFGSMFRRIAPGSPGKCLDIIYDLSQSSPAVQSDLDSMIAQTVEHSTSTSLNTLATWLKDHRDHPLYDRTVHQFALRTRADDPVAAASWAETISDETLRQETKAALSAPNR
ncbi:MAG TPA: hypothetical protein VG796_16785 [Verrucomicrobiales bacterium]|nr:hypothetical protein [Verrucomicrobiales bacterium]